MAIVKMKKFTLLTFEAHKAMLLKELQQFEDVHFKNLGKEELKDMDFLKQDFSQEQINRYDNEITKIKFAIDKITPFANVKKGISALREGPKTLSFEEFDNYLNQYDYQKTYDMVKSEDEKINAIKSETAKLRTENDGLRQWISLDISSTDLEKMKLTKAFIGTVSKVSAESFKSNVEQTYPTTYVEFLSSMKEDIAILVICPKEDYEDILSNLKTLGFSTMALNFKGIPRDIITSNEKRIEILKTQNEEALKSIEMLAGEYESLQIAFDYYETVLEREKACQNFLKLETVVLIEGWAPEEDYQVFEDIIKKVCKDEYYLKDEQVHIDNEEVPIKLKNNKMFSSFENITSMFSMPKYNEIDPTPVMTPFYILFFGLMVGDAGYGLLFLIATVIALKFFKLSESTKKFIRFFFYLSFGTIFAGFIYSSFFGISFFTPIKVVQDGVVSYKAILDTQTDVLPMMIVSVGLGVVQILFGIILKGYTLVKNGKFLDAIFDSLFWLICISAGIGLLLGVMGIVDPQITQISKWAFIISIVALAATQGRESPSLGGKIGSGLYSVYGISGYVGDFVSYTRIAALALSGAYIAFAFGIMSDLIPSGPVFVIVKIIILLLGHALNIGLSSLGAYVHTCRLQYVEFFGKFFDGGGVPFRAFKLKNKYIEIKK